MKSKSQKTKDKILDSAEKLFARRGFYGVTVREITREAGVDVALANYYFGRKRALFEAVFLRRAEQLNQERIDELEAFIDEAGGDPTVEQIIAAFTEPLHRKATSGGPGWKNYLALVAQINNSPEWGAKFMSKSFDLVVNRFIDALRHALPEAREEDLYWSYHFFSGALVLTFAETGRIDNLSQGVCKSTDLDAVYSRMPRFVAAGFRALCAPPPNS